MTGHDGKTKAQTQRDEERKIRDRMDIIKRERGVPETGVRALQKREADSTLNGKAGDGTEGGELL